MVIIIITLHTVGDVLFVEYDNLYITFTLYYSCHTLNIICIKYEYAILYSNIYFSNYINNEIMVT